MHNHFLLAKDIAPPRKATIRKVFKKQQSTDTYIDPFEASTDLTASVANSNSRHWTMPGIPSLKKRFSFSSKKAESFGATLREDEGSSRRRDRSITSSTFYDDENMAVTKNLSEPADFSPLQLTGKNMNELLLLLRPVSCSYILLFLIQDQNRGVAG